MPCKSKSSLKWLIVLILCVGFLPGLAQNRTIDSLKTLLEDPRNDRVKILIELAMQSNIAENYDAALGFANEAVPLALTKGDSLQIVMAYRFKGAALRRMERFDEALQIITNANAIAQRNNFISEMKFLTNSIAIIYSNKAQYDKALNFYFETLAIRETQGDQSEVSITLNNIAVVYSNLENYKEALEFYNKSFIAKKKAKDNYDMDKLLINIGLSEIELGELEKGAEHINEGLATCGNLCSNELKMVGERGLGLVNYSVNKLDESQQHYIISYELAKKSNNQRYQSQNLISLGKIAVKSGNLPEAEKFLKSAETIADKTGYNQLLIDAYKELFRLYSLQKNSTKEILYLKKYVAMSDTLISLDLVKNIATIQSRFDERENIRNIKTLEENIVLKNEAIARQQLLNIVLGSAAVLLVIVGILIYRLYVLTNKSNKQLDIKVKQRTQQLEEGQAHLQGVLQEQHLFIENIREEMKALTATINGVKVLENENFNLERALHLSVHTTTLTRLDALIDRIEKRGEYQRIYEIA